MDAFADFCSGFNNSNKRTDAAIAPGHVPMYTSTLDDVLNDAKCSLLVSIFAYVGTLVDVYGCRQLFVDVFTRRRFNRRKSNATRPARAITRSVLSSFMLKNYGEL